MTDSVTLYRCTKTVEKNGATFVAGKTYQRRLPCDRGIPLDKDGGGIVNFDDREIAEHFVKVNRMVCIQRLEHADKVYSANQIYSMSQNNGEYILYYGTNVGDQVTLTAATVQRHFRKSN